MSNPEFARHLPPRPWSYLSNTPAGAHLGKGFVYILDANGRKIGTVWGTPDEKIAVAELLCDASQTIPPTTEAAMK